ncbi:hypothetical protein [Frankia sp. Cr1]|uniref:hypothetical protein n=1 Tax=Frankia sp. Cr1 TaxID=3073931 RepID=UPI002AD239D8|nr:hypothetical protein [Frankia sp. Cr1]
MNVLVSDLLANLPGIRRVVAISDIGAAVTVGRTSPNLEVERAVQGTVLRPDCFQQDFTESPLVTIDNCPVTDAVEKITGRPARSFAAFLAATAATDI